MLHSFCIYFPITDYTPEHAIAHPASRAETYSVESPCGQSETTYGLALAVRFFARIRRPHSARSWQAQERCSSSLVAAILRAISSNSIIFLRASVCHRSEGA